MILQLLRPLPPALHVVFPADGRAQRSTEPPLRRSVAARATQPKRSDTETAVQASIKVALQIPRVRGFQLEVAQRTLLHWERDGQQLPPGRDALLRACSQQCADHGVRESAAELYARSLNRPLLEVLAARRPLGSRQKPAPELATLQPEMGAEIERHLARVAFDPILQDALRTLLERALAPISRSRRPKKR